MCESMRVLIPGQIYRHFKGNLYQVITVAIHSETGEKLVIYQKLYGDFKVHARPYEMFMSEVDHTKYPNVEQKYRFELISDNFSNDETQKSRNLVKKSKDIEFSNTEIEEVQTKIEEKTNQNIAEDEVSSEVQEGVNPLLIEFLDANTLQEKRNILLNMKDKITDRLINDIAVSLDVSIDEGDIDKRFNDLLYCIDIRSKFEINRLR